MLSVMNVSRRHSQITLVNKVNDFLVTKTIPIFFWGAFTLKTISFIRS